MLINIKLTSFYYIFTMWTYLHLFIKLSTSWQNLFFIGDQEIILSRRIDAFSGEKFWWMLSIKYEISLQIEVSQQIILLLSLLNLILYKRRLRRKKLRELLKPKKMLPVRCDLFVPFIHPSRHSFSFRMNSGHCHVFVELIQTPFIMYVLDHDTSEEGIQTAEVVTFYEQMEFAKFNIYFWIRFPMLQFFLV